MARGTIQRTPYGAAQAIVLSALAEWQETDGWAATKGCDLLALPSRRMVNMLYYKMIENLDNEGRIKFQQGLETAGLVRHPLLTSPTPRRRLKSVPDAPAGAVAVPKERWRAPEGWTPPGWSEERSYESAKQFIGWRREVK
jgi:hypothetical protein